MSHSKKWSKKQPEGMLVRLCVLRKFESLTDKIFKKALNCHYRKDVDRDDILDAIEAAVTARKICNDEKGFRTIPKTLQEDTRLGPPMEMVYWMPD